MLCINELVSRIEKIKEKIKKLKEENRALNKEVDRLMDVKRRALKKVEGIIEYINQHQG